MVFYKRFLVNTTLLLLLSISLQFADSEFCSNHFKISGFIKTAAGLNTKFYYFKYNFLIENYLPITYQTKQMFLHKNLDHVVLYPGYNYPSHYQFQFIDCLSNHGNSYLTDDFGLYAVLPLYNYSVIDGVLSTTVNFHYDSSLTCQDFIISINNVPYCLHDLHTKIYYYKNDYFYYDYTLIKIEETNFLLAKDMSHMRYYPFISASEVFGSSYNCVSSALVTFGVDRTGVFYI